MTRAKLLEPRSRRGSARRHGAALALLVGAAVSAGMNAMPVWAGPAIDFGNDASAGCGPSNVEGWEFQAVTGLTVSALGAWDDHQPGLLHDTPVGLYDASCQLLASATVPAGTAAPLLGPYRYVGITPVDLVAGETYRLAAVVMCDDSSPSFASLATVTVDAALSAVQTRRIAFGSALACPTETVTNFVFSPNFLIGPACGNGVVQAEEQCDDGNVLADDGCSGTCTCEPEVCGDGIVGCSEACDDGNTVDADTCSNQCIPVPEPAQLLLAVTGALVLVALRRLAAGPARRRHPAPLSAQP